MDEHLEELLDEHGLLDFWPMLQASMKDAIGFIKSEDLPTGLCQFGGQPFVDSDFEWPKFTDTLDFICQMDCSTLTRFSDIGRLPKEGILSFFYDVERQPWGLDLQDQGFAVVHQKAPSVVASHPSRKAMPQTGVAAQRIRTIPRVNSPPGDELLQNFPTDLYSELFDFIDTFEQWETGTTESNRMFGHPANIQDDMTKRMPINSDASFDEWVLLLQFDSNEDLMWGDGGRLYFWITKQDLADQNFGNAWCRLQCF